jgi:hypothetical protein
MGKRSGKCCQARSCRIERETCFKNGPPSEEIASASKAQGQAGEHDRPHEADPLDGGQAGVEFLLDRRKGYADAADALNVEKRSQANNQENA